MPIPDHAEHELSRLEGWHGLRPGMTRAEVVGVIGRSGAKVSPEVNEPDLLKVSDWGMELRFVDQGTGKDGEVLRQLSVEDDAYVWAGQKILGVPLHIALKVTQTTAHDTGWRPEDAVCESTADALPAESGDFADEFLLSEGTLWLPKTGIGLVMADGVVTDIVWRRAEDMPATFCGPVTKAQLELSRRTDLDDHLIQWLKQRHQSSAPSRQRNAVELVLAALLILALAYLGWKAWHEMISWEKAANVPGRLMSIETKPGPLAEKLYKVEFTDPAGAKQVVMLEKLDFYVPPREPGEPVMVSYMNNHPPRVSGPARRRDWLFLDYMPWALGALLSYFAVKLLLGWIAGRKRI